MKILRPHALLLLLSLLFSCQGDDFSPERAFYEDLVESDLVDLIRYSFLEQYGGVELEQKLTMAWLRDEMECDLHLEEPNLEFENNKYSLSFSRILDITCETTRDSTPDFEGDVMHNHVAQHVNGAKYKLNTYQQNNRQFVIAKLDSLDFRLSGNFPKELELERGNVVLKGRMDLICGIDPIDFYSSSFADSFSCLVFLNIFYFEENDESVTIVNSKLLQGKITRVSDNWLFTTSDGVVYPL